MKKTLSMILALLMSLSCASTIFAEEAIADEVEEEVVAEEAEEADAEAEEADEEALLVEEEAEEATAYDGAIAFLNRYGIYKGYTDGKMHANDDVQRYQMALFTARLSTGWVDDDMWEDNWHDTSSFNDLAGTAAENYYGAISYASQKGIIEGYGNGKFGPTDGITYQNALTMVVRTLGYKNLAWPWGYIEKAVNLGLTDGITGLAYTDNLNRGEVAQIIYNAMFVVTSDGTTLAAKNFGVNFGWETIVITGFGDTDDVQSGTVSFQIVEEDGTLDDTTYYTNGVEFGAHNNAAVLGYTFNVLFEQDAESNYVTIIGLEETEVETIYNLGLDSKDEDGVYPIQAYLADYTLASKFDTNFDAVNTSGSFGVANKIIVKTIGTNSVISEYGDGDYAIEWTTGDILKKTYEEDDDGEEVATGEWEVVWYYNELLDEYFQIKTSGKGDDDNFDAVEIVGIKYMTDDDYADLLDAIEASKEVYEDVTDYVVTTSIAKNAYASLVVFDVDADEAADYGIYADYRLGKISYSTADYTDEDGTTHDDVKTITLTDKSGSAYAAAYKKVVGEAYSASNVTKYVYGEDSTVDSEVITAWFADEEPEEGWAIYNYNVLTGEVKVLKTLEAETGIVRAYNVEKQYVVIDDTRYYFDYDELLGTMFYKATNSTSTKAIYADLLLDLFNQYVEYVVVDGKLVYIAVEGGSTTNLIIVEGYAGLSSDGYIVVDGYSTDDLELTTFKIASYDGWKKGDYFNYLTEDAAEASFAKGTLYAIKSSYATDYEDELAYNVELVDDWDIEGADFEIVAESREDGYLAYTYDGEDKLVKNSDMKIVVIAENLNNTNFAPIYVKTGKIPAEYAVSGTAIKVDSKTFIVYADVENIAGFNGNNYAEGLVVYLKTATTSAKYDGYDTEDWYLLGASNYDAIVWDLYDGTEKTITAKNVELTKGYIYSTIDGILTKDTIIYEDDVTAAGLEAAMAYSYADGTIYKYMLNLDADVIESWFDDDEFDSEECYDNWAWSAIYGHKTAYTDDFSTSVKIFVVATDGAKVESITACSTIKDLEEADVDLDNGTYDNLFVWTVEDKDAVLYIFADSAEGVVTYGDEETIVAEHAIQIAEENGGADAYITAEATYTEVYTDGELTGANIASVKFEYVGDATEDTHAAIAAKSYTFGTSGECLFEIWNTLVDGEHVYGTIAGEKYLPHAQDTDACDMIKSVEVVFDKDVVIDEPTTVEVTFTDSEDNEYVLYVTATIGEDEDGDLEFYFDFDTEATMKIGANGIYDFVLAEDID